MKSKSVRSFIFTGLLIFTGFFNQVSGQGKLSVNDQGYFDLPELKENWSFLWQQTEYVMGGGETDFMFLVLATNQLLKK